MGKGNESIPNTSRPQNITQTDVSDTLHNLIGGRFDQQFVDAFAQLLSGGAVDTREIEEGAFRNFREFGIPAINAQAAGFSAIQNSRRVGEISRAAGNITSQLAGIKAQFLDSARNRQLQAILGPLSIGAGFGTARGTTDTLVGSDVLGQVLALVGTIGGAFIGVPGGAAAGGAAGAAAGSAISGG